jgi:hypothetical protein
MSVTVVRSPVLSASASTWAVAALCLVTCTALSLLLILRQAYPGCYDELQHVSYAAFLQESGRWLPQFGAQRLLLRDDMGAWDSRLNYLGHPSPFYLFISAVLDRTLPPTQAILAPRIASGALIWVGVALALLAGRRWLAPDRLATTVFCCLVALCPQLLTVSAQVSNDSLAFLGGALAYWGALRWRAPPPGWDGWPGAAAVAAGLTAALWAKPNAGLVVAVWVAAFTALSTPPRGRRPAPAEWLFILGGLALGALPYGFVIRDYGAVVPITAEQVGEVSRMPGLVSYAAVFPLDLGYTFGFAHVGVWPLPGFPGVLMAALFWLLVAAAVLGAVRARRQADAGTAAGMAAAIAFAVVLPVHFWYSAARLGYSLPATSFRYYLPIWPALSQAMAGTVRGRWPLAALAAATIIVGWVWR